MYAEPEVELRRINASNPFLVVASDGVFEFLSNQDVVDMVSSTISPYSGQYLRPSSCIFQHIEANICEKPQLALANI